MLLSKCLEAYSSDSHEGTGALLGCRQLLCLVRKLLTPVLAVMSDQYCKQLPRFPPEAGDVEMHPYEHHLLVSDMQSRAHICSSVIVLKRIIQHSGISGQTVCTLDYWL